MRKGFTLIEMIGIILVLGLLMIFIFPSLTNTLRNNNKMKFESFAKNLELAMDNYMVYEEKIAAGSYITLKNLLENNYIEDIPVMLTGDKLDTEVQLSDNYRIYVTATGPNKYKLCDENGTNCIEL